MTIRDYLKKYKELISYAFWGAATTLVNYVVYFMCTKAIHINYFWSNIFSWAISVLFAFYVNKQFVFADNTWSSKVVLRELSQFVSARILSGAIETGMLMLFVDIVKLNDGVVKLVAGVVVILLNYVASKLIIFKKSKTEKGR